MGNKIGDVIGGYNSFMNKQKEVKEDEASVSFLKFNTSVKTVFECVPVTKVPDLTTVSYIPDGYTALYDAIAQGVRVAEKRESEFDRVICVVMTDGEENSSRETTKEQVRNIITSKEAKGNWTFVYIGENPERWAKETGQSLGNAAPYDHTDQRRNFLSTTMAVSNFRAAPELRQYNLL
jgi:uncharacterized protein YegL